MNLKNKKALITGATGGIGNSLVEKFYSLGCSLVATGTNEEKLNNLGIYTYEQISSFDEKMINLVTDAIEFFPGRIERDQWVKQAKSLFDAKYNG